MPYLELTILLALIILNGILAMSELAIVSAKKVHLRRLAAEGNSTAARALAFAEDTGRFLPTVQVGITLVGVLAGAFSGASFSGYLADFLEDIGLEKDNAELVAFTIVVVGVTYLTLIIGELVPKELALRHPEKWALFATPILHYLSKIAWPAVWLLQKSSRLVLWLLRAHEKPASTVTEEDVKAMIAEGTDHGVFDEREKIMLSGVMLLADKPIRAFMMPRVDVITFDCDATLEEIRGIMAGQDFTRYPVRVHNDEHHILGLVEAKDILDTVLAGKPFVLRDLVRDVPFFPDMTSTIKVIDYLRGVRQHLAVIVDEHGSFEGIVTLTDLLAVITGDLHDHQGSSEIARRDDGSWLMDGWVLIERAFEEIGLSGKFEDEGFHTLAGFILSHSPSLPKAGDSIEYKGHIFEVIDMDGWRIDKVLVRKI